MRPWLLVSLMTALGWLAMHTAAHACTCAPTDHAKSYAGSEHVLRVRVVEVAETTDTYRVYRAELLANDFKGCLEAGATVLLETGVSGAACGMTLPVGGDMLVYAWQSMPAALESAEARLSFAMCDPHVPWASLPARTRDALTSRPRACGGRQACADGSPVVNCFANPCQVSSCDVEGAICEADYCGGCNARWYDDAGARVCTPAPMCDPADPARRYAARSREACKAVRFACDRGQTMFFDDCGCGCELPG